MAESIAYISPFPTLPNGQLVISLDTETLSEYLQQTSEDSFDVDQEAQPFQVIIKSEVKDESKALEWLDAQKERTEDLEPPIKSLKKIVGLCLVASSPSSRFRRLQIEGSDDNAEVAMLDINELQNGKTFSFNPVDYRGALRIKAYLVYKKGQEYEYLRCGESNELTFYFSDHETIPGSDIDVNWIKFAEDFPDNQDQYFRLTYKKDGTPTLWLNKSIEKFFAVMSLRTKSGKQAVVRDAMNHRIASQVWHLTLAEALTKVATISVDEVDDYAEEDLASYVNGFQTSVLREFLAFLQLGDDFHAGLKQLVHNVIDNPEWIAEKSSDFVQDKCLPAEPFLKFYREFLES